MSHDEAIPNQLAKFELGRTWILPFLPVPSIAKKHLCLLMSGWCYFEGVWIMSRWCLRVSGEASMPNLFMKLNLQPLLEEGKRNGARRISGGILGTIPLRFPEQQ